MKMNLTPEVEKPKRRQLKREIPPAELAADTASHVTRKRESTKRAKALAPDNIPMELDSKTLRKLNNETLNQEDTSSRAYNQFGEIIRLDNYKETTDRLKELERNGDITLVEETGIEDFEDKQREEAQKARNIEFSIPHSEMRKFTTRDSLWPHRQENLKTLSDSKKERNSRGVLGKFWDKMMDYVSPKDLYDEDEEVDNFTALGRQYEKEQAEKAALEHRIKYSAPDILNSKIDSDEDTGQFGGRMTG